MKKRLWIKKRLAMVLLAVALMIGAGLTCCAEENGMAIGTPEDFLAFLQTAAADPGADAHLTCDIDLSGAEDIQPVALYSGLLDGNGFALQNLRIEAETGDAALFLEIAPEGRVQNLTVSGLFQGEQAAALAVVNRGSVVRVSGSAEVFSTEVGAGLVCENFGTIDGCAHRGLLYPLNGSLVGGVVGVNHGAVTGCTAYSAIDGTVSSPYARSIGGVCAESHEGSLVADCTNLGRIIAGDQGAGLVGASYGAELRSLINVGDVQGSSLIGGVVGVVEGGSVSACVNYGAVACSHEGAGGIAAEGSAKLSGCKNYGAVAAESHAAGIASRWNGEIALCSNHGAITGYEYTAGICSAFSGAMTGCDNRGAITGQSHYTAGVVSELRSGSVELCSNAAPVIGGANNWGNSLCTGGIAGHAMGGTLLADVCNTGFVDGDGECGGLAGRLEGTLRSAMNFSESVTGANAFDGATMERVYSLYEGGEFTAEPGVFYSGELAWLLNTDGGSGENRGVWSQPDDCPELADENHLPVRRVTCSSSRGSEEVLFTGPDGKVTPPSGHVLYEYVCVDEDGREIPSEELFREGRAASESTVSVGDYGAFYSALTDRRVEEIVLLNSIHMDSDIALRDDKTIVGQGHRLYLGEHSFTSRADVRLVDLSIDSAAPILLTGGTLTVEGFLETNAAIELQGASLELSAGRILNKNEADGLPSILADGASFEGYAESDGAHAAFSPIRSTAAVELVAPAELNKSLAYDVYPEIRNGIVYFFLPCSADPTGITVCSVNGEGETVEEWKSLNLTDGSAQVRLFGLSYPAQALQSQLPTLAFDIDERFGSIAAMNSSEDHTARCYGSVRLDVTAEQQKEKKWFSFVSTEKDSGTDGSMFIRGRGNSTWDTALDVKKPYQFKLEQKVNVLNMGEHKTWILLMNDEHLVRNKLGLDLAQDIGLTNSSLGEFVDVFMNGRYLGNYLLCERVEMSKERVNVAKLDDEYKDKRNSTIGLDLTGGYLLEFDNWGGDTLQVVHEATGNVVSVKEPEDLDTEVTEYNAYSYIREYVLNFIDAVYGDGALPDGRSYLDVIDRDSFARYFFHQEFLMNEDCGRGSTFMYKDRDSIDPLLYAGPVWDHDRIFEGETSDWLLSEINHAGTELRTIYNQLSRRDDFARMLIEAYENTDIPEVLANASRHIDTYAAQLEQSAKMNSLLWELPEFDIEWLRDAMDARAAWIAENYKTLMDLAE